MKQVRFKTFSLRKEDIKRDWVTMDASERVLGQLATEVAVALMGKNKNGWTPHTDNGDYVVVTNAAKVVVTGNKEADKFYARHSNYPGGFKKETLAELRARKPEDIIKLAVKNMLPKNRTRTERLARLKVYAGAEHPHTQVGAKVEEKPAATKEEKKA